MCLKSLSEESKRSATNLHNGSMLLSLLSLVLSSIAFKLKRFVFKVPLEKNVCDVILTGSGQTEL